MVLQSSNTPLASAVSGYPGNVSAWTRFLNELGEAGAAIHGDKHSRSSVGKNCWPQPSDTNDGRDQKDCLETEREGYVLEDIAHCALREIDHEGDIYDRAMKHGSIRGLQGHIGTAAHGNPDIGRSQRRGIIDAVADFFNKD